MIQVRTELDLRAATQAIQAALNSGKPGEAVRLSRTLRPTTQYEDATWALQTYTLAQAGEMSGRDSWTRAANDRYSSQSASNLQTYNTANTFLTLWSQRVRRKTMRRAWLDDRELLTQARAGYRAVGFSEDAQPHHKTQSLTNLGNSLSTMGRDLEALEYWRQALAIDPQFGMALGNIGIAYSHYASTMRGHTSTLISIAARYLDDAIAQRVKVVRYGGPSALRNFESARERIAKVQAFQGRFDTVLSDPYESWCMRHELFLHVSHDCIRDHTKTKDPLGFASLSQVKKRPCSTVDLIDAFNALKRDYCSSRYLAWLAFAGAGSNTTLPDTGVSILNTKLSAEWGLPVGLAVQSLASGVDLLDKVANFVHLYLGTSIPARRIYFHNWWGANKKYSANQVEWLTRKPAFNLGAIALCGLADEYKSDPSLVAIAQSRHAATHRFLISHTTINVPVSADAIQRIQRNDLEDKALRQLAIARAAMVYLVRLIDRHEAYLSSLRGRLRRS